MINRVTLSGRFTKKFDLRKTNNGMSVIKFTLACDRMKKKGEEKAQADFPSLIAFGNTADYIAKYHDKGMMAFAEGRLQTGSYDRNGLTVYTTDIIVDNIQLIFNQKQNGNSKPQDEPNDGIPFEISSDDLPF